MIFSAVKLPEKFESEYRQERRFGTAAFTMAERKEFLEKTAIRVEFPTDGPLHYSILPVAFTLFF